MGLWVAFGVLVHSPHLKINIQDTLKTFDTNVANRLELNEIIKNFFFLKINFIKIKMQIKFFINLLLKKVFLEA